MAIIPAGGSGRRMGNDFPKQYLLLRGAPILALTLSVFQKSPVIQDIVLVVPQGDVVSVRREIVEKYDLHKVSRVLAGGEQRQDSVRRGLDALGPQHDVVVIHDGVRPFVSETLLEIAQVQALKGISVAVGIPAQDTIKAVDAEGWVYSTLRRERLWLTQTPQAFPREVIHKAYEKAYQDRFYGTDDASLVERMGVPVRMIPGSPDNIKITTKEDLVVAEARMASLSLVATQLNP